MRHVVSRLAAAAAAVALGAAQAPQGPPASLIQNGRVETRQATAIDREIAPVATANAEPAWLIWRVPMVAGDRELCNSYYNDRSVYSRAFVMDWNPPGAGGAAAPKIAPPTGPVPIEAGTGLLVLVRTLDGGVERVRTLADDCPIDAGGRTVYWLGGVTTAESLRFLESLTRSDRADRFSADSRRNVAQSAVTAISLHRDAAADAVLDRLAASDTDRELRGQAASALGSTRGAHGLATLERLLAAEKDADMRRSLVGALGLTREPGTVNALRPLLRDADARIRAEAIYWFAQRGGTSVIGEVTKLVEAEADDTVRRRGVSGLARLPASDAVPALLQLARSSPNALVRREAVSALSNSRDPRAMAFMEELIRR